MLAILAPAEVAMQAHRGAARTDIADDRTVGHAYQ